MRHGFSAPRAVAIGAVGLVLLAYLPSLGGPFFGDDHAYVVDNAALDRVPLDRPWRLFVTRTNPYEYLPLRDLSYRIDLALFGRTPAGFKAHNLALYALCCLLVWLAARELARLLECSDNRASWVASIATAMFAAHPAHVESVAWISGRKDLVSGVWALAALWCFVVGVRRDRGGQWLIAAVVCFALALLGKATVLPLVAVLALLVLGRGSSLRSHRRVWIALATMAVVALAALALHSFVGAQADVLRDRAPVGPVTDWLPARILGALAGIALFPFRLRLIYDLGGGGLPRLVDHLLALAVVTGGVWSVWRMRRGGSLPAWGFVFFAVMCTPFLQILPYRTWSLASERFLFLPVLGLVLVVASLLTRFRPSITAVLAFLLFAPLLGGTFARSQDWRSSEVLLAGTAKLSPANHLAVEWGLDLMIGRRAFDEALAAASAVREPAIRAALEDYVQAHRALAAGDREQAAKLVRRVADGPAWDSPVFRGKLGNLALSAGEAGIAEQAYRQVLNSYPAQSGARYNLALALERLGRKEQAAEQLRLAAEGGARRGDVWNRLGLLERELGRLDAAESAFLSALRDDPDHWHAAYNLGRLYVSEGRVQDAVEVLMAAKERAARVGADPTPIDRLIAELE